MALEQLIYVSTAKEEFLDDVFDDILESSVRHNAPQEVTGMILYTKGSFMQVIEGEESAVSETYDRICKDTRHSNIILLSRGPISKREFSTWSMGLRRLSKKDAEENPACVFHGNWTLSPRQTGQSERSDAGVVFYS